MGTVKNATKVFSDGLKFDSKLEYYFYEKAREKGLKCVREAFKQVYQPKFEYMGKSFREMTFTADFHVPLPDANYLVEIKSGNYKTDAYKLRRKLIMYYLCEQNKTMEKPFIFIELCNKREIENFIENAIQECDESEGVQGD
jgi:hypothetical protein